MKSAFFLVLILYLLSQSTSKKVKEGKSFNLTLTENKSLDKEFQLSKNNLLLYFRPNEKDSTLGIITINYNDFHHQLDSYHQSILIKNYSSGAVTFKCNQGPCQSEVVGFSYDQGLLLSSEEQELVISKTKPIDWFTIQIPSKKSFDRLLLSLRTEDASLELDKVGIDIFGDVDLQVHEEKNRMFLVINSIDETTCENCQIDVLVSADNLLKKSKVYVQLEQLNQEIEMQLDQKKVDYLTYFQKPNFYKIKIPSSKFEGFILEVIPFVEAIPRIRANIDSRPEYPDDYSFDSILEGEFFGEALSYDFRKDDLSGDYLYVALSGMQGLYQISFTKSRQNPILMIGDVYTSQVNGDSVHEYSLQVQPLDDDNGYYVHIVGSLLSKSENNCKLSIKECKSSECKKDEIGFDDNQLQDEDKMELVEEDRKQILKLQPGCKNKDSDGYCWYIVGISSNNEEGEELKKDLHYILYAELAQGHIKLKKNSGFSSTIIEGGLEQLVYYYEKSKEDIGLQISVSTGNVAFLVSTKCKVVDTDCAQWFGGIDNKVDIRGKKFKEGAYYITVQGLVTTTYTITVQVLNKQNLNIINLKEGQSYRSEINPIKNEIEYFRIEVDFDQDIESNRGKVDLQLNPDIQLSLQAAKFKLALMVNVGEDEMPSVNKFDEISLNNYLIIQAKSDNYQRQGVYSVGVQFLAHDTLEEYDDNTNIPFTITYTTSRTIKPINLNSMIFDEVYHKNVYYFVYHPYSSNPNSQLLLSKQNIDPSKPTKEPTILISSDINTDNANRFELTLEKNKSSTYIITKEEVTKLCEYEEEDEDDDLYNNQNIYCEIFVSIESTTKLKYSLIMWTLGVPIELNAGHSVTFNLENIENGQQMQFFYQITSYSYDVFIYLQSYYGQISYQLQLDNYKFQGQAHNTHSKSISTQALESCKPKCVLYIQVTSITQQSEISFGDQNRVVDIDDTFSLMVTQKFMEIRNGQSIEVVVRSNKPKYFIYSELSFKDDQPIQITFQELMGKGQLCVSISDDNNLRMPFYDDFDGCDFRLTGNYFKLYPSNFTSFIQDPVNPILIIELSVSQTNDIIHDTGKFNLMLYNEDQTQLILAHPTRVDLNHTKTSATYTYFNQAKEDLEIKITRITGYAYLTIKYCLDDATTQCKQQTFQNKTFLTGQSQQLISIPVDSSGFCLFCTYYLTLEITDEISLSAILYITTQTEFVKLMQGIQFVDYLTGNDVNLYRIPFDVNKQLEITGKVYNGNPKIYVGYSTIVSDRKYQFGPYSQNQSRIQAIIPPRSHFDQNKDKYNITHYSNSKNTLASHFHEDDLYLYVTSDQSSNYTLQVSQNSTLLLQDGLVTLTTLSKNQPSTVFYYYHLYADTPILTIKCLNEEIQRENQFIIGITAQYSPEYDLSNLTTVSMQFHSSHQNLVSYTFPSQPGFYQITINSLLSQEVNNENLPHYYFDKNGKPQPIFSQFQYDFNLNFIQQLQLEAAVNSRDTYLIELNTWTPGSLYQGSENFYELYIHQAQNIGLQVENCEGTLNISYTQDYNEFLNLEAKSSRSLSGQNFDSLINARVDPLYIMVQAETQSTYRLSVQTSSKTLPHGRIILGADGDLNIKVDPKDPDHITVSFKKLKCIQCNAQEQSDTDIEYEIVWGSSLGSLNMIGKCQASNWGKYSAFDKANFGKKSVGVMNFENPEEKLIQEIHVDDQSEAMSLYVSVVARISKFNNERIDNYQLFYKNSQVILAKNAIYMFKHKKQEFAIAVGVLLLFTLLMLCCLCYFFSRLRKLRKDQIEVDLQKKMYVAKEKQQQGKQSQEENKYGEFHDEQSEDPQQQQPQQQ